uniref:Uncharacterized protein n=1 Tax=Solanum lycopersicum TaxID=4081 RepID=A0A3Q7GGB6_SOLLC
MKFENQNKASPELAASLPEKGEGECSFWLSLTPVAVLYRRLPRDALIRFPPASIPAGAEEERENREGKQGKKRNDEWRERGRGRRLREGTKGEVKREK